MYVNYPRVLWVIEIFNEKLIQILKILVFKLQQMFKAKAMNRFETLKYDETGNYHEPI